MDNSVALIIALIGMVSALTTLIFDRLFRQNQLKQESYDAVILELIQRRIAAYTGFFQALKNFSSVEWKKAENASPGELWAKVEQCSELFHDALYSEVGVVASHETRELIVCARTICKKLLSNKDENIKTAALYQWLFWSLWAIHDALRADLGITQPWMRTDLDRRVNRIFQHDDDLLAYIRTKEKEHWDYEKQLSEVIKPVKMDTTKTAAA